RAACRRSSWFPAATATTPRRAGSSRASATSRSSPRRSRGAGATSPAAPATPDRRYVARSSSATLRAPVPSRCALHRRADLKAVDLDDVATVRLDEVGGEQLAEDVRLVPPHGVHHLCRTREAQPDAVGDGQAGVAAQTLE